MTERRVDLEAILADPVKRAALLCAASRSLAEVAGLPHRCAWCQGGPTDDKESAA